MELLGVEHVVDVVEDGARLLEARERPVQVVLRGRPAADDVLAGEVDAQLLEPEQQLGAGEPVQEVIEEDHVRLADEFERALRVVHVGILLEVEPLQSVPVMCGVALHALGGLLEVARHDRVRLDQLPGVELRPPLAGDAFSHIAGGSHREGSSEVLSVHAPAVSVDDEYSNSLDRHDMALLPFQGMRSPHG